MKGLGKIAFIGAGNMAEAMVKGIIKSGLARPHNIYITNKQDNDKLKKLHDAWGVHVDTNKKNVLENADTVLLLVKPQDMEEALQETAGLITPKQLVVSVAAGISLGWLQTRLGEGVPVVRTMPNLPCQVSEGATAVSTGTWADTEHQQVVEKLFSSIGMVVNVKEELIDTITGLSGSGPAYVYLMISALAEAGVQAGLTKEMGFQLAVQTVLGAAKLVKESGLDSNKLMSLTASKGGTTSAGLKELEDGDFATIIGAAVKMAAKRSKELSLAF